LLETLVNKTALRHSVDSP